MTNWGVKMNLGVDFGSTYSSFSTYNSATASVELCRPTQGQAEAIPTVACLNWDEQLLTGHPAREQMIEDPDSQYFQAFKMLLTEKRPEILEERGFTDAYTPQRITEAFLRQQVNRILSDHAETGVENLVICAPEVWTTRSTVKNGMLDGRNVLREICGSISSVKNVQVVSEPAAASAYFAYQYQKQTGEPLQGRVLIVDYGGGTLDLTLTELHPLGSSVEIKVLFRAGAGENTQGQIGNAGIAYMERVMKLAIEDSDVLPPEQKVPYDMDFRRTVSALESALMNQVNVRRSEDDSLPETAEKLLYAVDECGENIGRLKRNKEAFTKVKYRKKILPVTYAHLQLAYEEIIMPNLTECLETTRTWMNEHGIDYLSSAKSPFHIVLVGGFGKYILVQKAVQEFFNFSETGDIRFRYGLGSDREYAVSKGAALLADKVMSLKNTAPYSIGLVSCNQEGKRVLNYAISFRQEIVAGKEYWISGENGPKNIINPKNALNCFLIGTDENRTVGLEMPVRPVLVEKISRAYAELETEYVQAFPNRSKVGIFHNIGFSMDESEVVTLLIRETKTGSIKRIELSSYAEMFDLTEAKEVTED